FFRQTRRFGAAILRWIARKINAVWREKTPGLGMLTCFKQGLESCAPDKEVLHMNAENYVTLEFPSRSANEGFARAAAACFAAQLDPTLEEINDIKTAVSEAVTNAIVHAYPDRIGRVVMKLRRRENQ